MKIVKKILSYIWIATLFIWVWFWQENSLCLNSPVSFSTEQNVLLGDSDGSEEFLSDWFEKEYLVVEFVDDWCAQSIVLANDHNGNQDFIDRTSWLSTCDYTTIVAEWTLETRLNKIGENSYVWEKSKELLQDRYIELPTYFWATPISDVTKVIIIDREWNLVATKVWALPDTFYDICLSWLECSWKSPEMWVDEWWTNWSNSCQYIEQEEPTEEDQDLSEEDLPEDGSWAENSSSWWENSWWSTWQQWWSDWWDTWWCAAWKCTWSSDTWSSSSWTDWSWWSDSGCASGMCSPSWTDTTWTSWWSSSWGSSWWSDTTWTNSWWESTWGSDSWWSESTGSEWSWWETTWSSTWQQGSDKKGRLQIQIPRETERDIVTNNDTINTENSKKTYRTIVKLVWQWVWIVLWLIIFVVVIYWGISLILSRGKPDKFKEALNILLYAWVWLWIALVAYSLVTIIINLF